MTVAGYTPAQVRKATLAALGAIAQILAVVLAVGGLIPAGWPLAVATVIIAVAQVYGVYRAPNSGVPLKVEASGGNRTDLP